MKKEIRKCLLFFITVVLIRSNGFTTNFVKGAETSITPALNNEEEIVILLPLPWEHTLSIVSLGTPQECLKLPGYISAEYYNTQDRIESSELEMLSNSMSNSFLIPVSWSAEPAKPLYQRR